MIPMKCSFFGFFFSALNWVVGPRPLRSGPAEMEHERQRAPRDG